MGPLRETKSGSKYIITLCDCFSSKLLLRLHTLKSKFADGVADFFFQVFCRHGWPKIIQCDNGRDFINEMNGYLFQSTSIKHCVTSAYHPQRNGFG